MYLGAECYLRRIDISINNTFNYLDIKIVLDVINFTDVT